jgi:hypothetical protein
VLYELNTKRTQPVYHMSSVAFRFCSFSMKVT